MTIIFTSELNKLAWQIKKAHNLPWGEAFRLAMRAIELPAQGVQQPTSFFGVWTLDSVRAVAGHFWGLAKAYEELQDTGRAVAMTRVSKALYGMADMGDMVSLSTLRGTKHFGESVISEAFDYFASSATNGYTCRTVHLIGTEGAWQYGTKVRASRWFF